MKRLAWHIYISIGIVIVSFAPDLNAEEPSPSLPKAADAPHSRDRDERAPYPAGVSRVPAWEEGTPQGGAPTVETERLPLPPLPSLDQADAAPNLEINVPPPPDSPVRRGRLGHHRTRSEDSPAGSKKILGATRVTGQPSPSEDVPAPRVFPPPGAATPWSGQWSITNPHGTMTHSWEQSRSEDGYSFHREHIWTAPDGTLLRGQQFDVTGTDPNNYQRERTITLRDGRTIQHSYTRSWDGQTLETEQSFSGPNGQSWTRQHTWAPDSDAAPQPPSLTGSAASVPQGPSAGPVQKPPIESPPPDTLPGKRLGLLKNSGGTERATLPATRPSGFTLGASGWRGWNTPGLGPATRPSRPPESTPSLGKRLRAESPNAERPGSLRPSILPRPRGKH